MDLEEKKKHLISSLISEGALRTKDVIEAFWRVKREDFVLPQYKEHAYADEPLPLIEGQTISQPFTVAAMTEALQPKKGQKILEIGAGSGYQAAILSEMVGPKGKIITVERLHTLAELAAKNIQRCGCKNVAVVEGDGTLGYEKRKPYDGIIVTASAPDVPKKLVEQLKTGGKMVIPVGDRLFLIEKITKTKIEKTFLGHYVFVPLVGKYGHKG